MLSLRIIVAGMSDDLVRYIINRLTSNFQHFLFSVQLLNFTRFSYQHTTANIHSTSCFFLPLELLVSISL